jgi:hypothetical protein
VEHVYILEPGTGKHHAPAFVVIVHRYAADPPSAWRISAGLRTGLDPGQRIAVSRVSQAHLVHARPDLFRMRLDLGGDVTGPGALAAIVGEGRAADAYLYSSSGPSSLDCQPLLTTRTGASSW